MLFMAPGLELSFDWPYYIGGGKNETQDVQGCSGGGGLECKICIIWLEQLKLPYKGWKTKQYTWRLCWTYNPNSLPFTVVFSCVATVNSSVLLKQLIINHKEKWYQLISAIYEELFIKEWGNEFMHVHNRGIGLIPLFHLQVISR